MTMYLIGPDGLIKFPEDTIGPCPECGGKGTVQAQSHKMSCSTYMCSGCRKWVRTGTGHNCSTKLRGRPRARQLFPIPPRPRDNRWRIEWRWKPDVWKQMVRDAVDEECRKTLYPNATSYHNDWGTHGGDGALRTQRVAVNRVAVLRRRFPGKSWRMRGYSVV